jgi:2'-5' RNA ligase
MRAFLAVSVEGEETVARLRALLSELRSVRGLRTVPPHQLHFTLKFFEDLPEAKVAVAKAAAARAAGVSFPFSLSLSLLGVFPARAPARVLWIGCGSGSEALSGLASSVEKEFTFEGFAPEARPFSPHLTLARVKDPRAARDAARFVAANCTFDGGTMEVKELVLYHSLLGPSGAAHTPLGRFPLRPR